MIDEQIITMWQVNQRVTETVIKALPADVLDMRSGAKGRNISAQFAHIHSVRRMWLEVEDKKLVADLLKPDPKTQYNNTELIAMLQASSKAIEQMIKICSAKEYKSKAGKRGLLPLIGYLIAHESHHRGAILLTAKQNGFSLPESLKYGIWDWMKL